MRQQFVKIVMAFALLIQMAGVKAGDASGTPGYTQLILHINATTTVTLVLVTHAGACTLVNSNSNYAAVDLGAANKTAQNNGCPAFTAGNTYRLATSFDVNATCSGACANWNLTAALPAAAATGLTWKLGGNTLTTTATAIANGLTYGTAQNEAFDLDVRTNGGAAAATGQVSQAIDFTATDTATGTATATATLNAEEINEPGLSLFFVQDASGAPVTGGAFNAALDFGAVSAYGSLPPGVTRPSVTASSYTVETLVDVDVEKGNFVSANYTMQADLAASAPTGLTYEVDGVSLTTSPQNITATGSYATNQAYTLDIVVNSAAPGSGGPTVDTALSDTLNFVVTAN